MKRFINILLTLLLILSTLLFSLTFSLKENVNKLISVGIIGQIISEGIVSLTASDLNVNYTDMIQLQEDLSEMSSVKQLTEDYIENDDIVIKSYLTNMISEATTIINNYDSSYDSDELESTLTTWSEAFITQYDRLDTYIKNNYSFYISVYRFMTSLTLKIVLALIIIVIILLLLIINKVRTVLKIILFNSLFVGIIQVVLFGLFKYFSPTITNTYFGVSIPLSYSLIPCILLSGISIIEIIGLKLKK